LSSVDGLGVVGERAGEELDVHGIGREPREQLLVEAGEKPSSTGVSPNMGTSAWSSSRTTSTGSPR
jgi:hypothetical protein